MHGKNQPRKLESSTSVGEDGSVHVCRKCRWPFSNLHPSQKKRAAHKKQCGKIDGYPLVVLESDGEEGSFGNYSGRSFVSINVEEESVFGEERDSEKFEDKKDNSLEEAVNKSHQKCSEGFSQDSSSRTSKLLEQNDTSNGSKNTIKHDDVAAKHLDVRILSQDNRSPAENPVKAKRDVEKIQANGNAENLSSFSMNIEVQQCDELVEPETLFASVDVERSKKPDNLSQIHEMVMSKVDTKSIELEGDKNAIHSNEIGITVATASDVDELQNSSPSIILQKSVGSEKETTGSVEGRNGNQENGFSPICDPHAEIIQINNDYRSESSTSQDDNPLPQNKEPETQGRKIKEEIKTRAVNWQNVRDGIVAEIKKSHIPLKNHEIGYDQSEILSTSTEISEIKTKTSSIKESLRSRLLPDAKKVQKECSSHSKLPANKNTKGKTRAKPQWTPFMCCPTTVK